MMTESEKNSKTLNKPARRKLLLGAGTASAIAAWHKPVINQIVTPAHAQTSPEPEPLPTPEELCPMITIGNVVFGPVSGTNTPPVCTATFDVLSADAATSLTITDISNGTLPDDATIEVQDLGEASSTTGPRIVWTGPATDAPFCNDLMPIGDITITVTATCAAVAATETDGDTFSQEFLLSEILAA